MHYVFDVYPYTAQARFDCPSCGKKNRTRSFKVECTVNPFNKGQDGIPLNASQVRAQSKDRALTERLQFLRRPLCASCESGLSYADRKALFAARREESVNA